MLLMELSELVTQSSKKLTKNKELKQCHSHNHREEHHNMQFKEQQIDTWFKPKTLSISQEPLLDAQVVRPLIEKENATLKPLILTKDLLNSMPVLSQKRSILFSQRLTEIPPTKETPPLTLELRELLSTLNSKIKITIMHGEETTGTKTLPKRLRLTHGSLLPLTLLSTDSTTSLKLNLMPIKSQRRSIPSSQKLITTTLLFLTETLQ